MTVEGKRGGNFLLKATFVAMVLGALSGWTLDIASLAPATEARILSGLDAVTTAFLRLIRMVVAPLVLTTLTFGVAQMGGTGNVGKVGTRALIWFLAFSFVAIGLGLMVVNVLEPGRDLNLTAVKNATATAGAEIPSFSAKAFVEEFTPASIFEALAKNNILQVVVFSIFAGLALGALGERVSELMRGIEQLAAMVMKIATYVIALAPIAVFSALTSTVLEHGISSLTLLGGFIASFYFALILMAGIIALAGMAFLGRRILPLILYNREPMLVALSTSSSEAAFPASLKAIEDFGVSRKVAGFLLPIGYSFNLDGSMVYLAFAVVFIAQAYGIDLSISTQIGIMFFLLLATKGAAGVPRAGLLILATALQVFGLPAEGVVLVLAVDALMDMGRTTVNVFGNAVATACIAKMIGELGPERENKET